MITYIMLAGEPIAVRRIFPLVRTAIESSAIHDGTWTSKISTNGRWAIVAVDFGDELIKSRIHISQRGAFVINGPALWTSGHNEELPIAALDIIADGDVDDLFREIGGAYNCASVTQKNGLCAFGDFSGVYPVYAMEGRGFVAVSNRSTALGTLFGGEYDLRSLSWLVGHANVFGRSMPSAGVKLIPPGRYMQAKPLGVGDPVVKEFRETIWPTNGEGRENLSSGEWDEITHDLIENIRSASSMINGPIKTALTGGKDSRLVLSLAKAAGVADRIETFTNGPEDSAETTYAAKVAKVAGVFHKPIIQNSNPALIPMSVAWDRFRMHPFRYEHAVCPWDGGTGSFKGVDIELTGFGGELYRGSHAYQFRQVDYMNVKDLAPLWVNYHQKMDMLGILQPEYALFQREWLTDWVRGAEAKWGRRALPEMFYVENRLAHWNGPLAQAVPGRIKMMPLLSAKVARKTFELSTKSRVDELIHFEIMRRAAPELTSIPFLGDVWNARIRAENPSLSLPDHAEKKPMIKATTHEWKEVFVKREVSNICAMIKDAAASTQISEIINVASLIKKINEKQGNWLVSEVKAILSVIGIAFTLTGTYSKARDIL